MSKILVVDDDQDLRESLLEVLQNYGFEIDSAKNSEQALEKLNDHNFDLVLLDFHGELLQPQRAEQTPVVVDPAQHHVGKAQAVVEVRGHRGGVVGII